MDNGIGNGKVGRGTNLSHASNKCRDPPVTTHHYAVLGNGDGMKQQDNAAAGARAGATGPHKAHQAKGQASARPPGTGQ